MRGRHAAAASGSARFFGRKGWLLRGFIAFRGRLMNRWQSFKWPRPSHGNFHGAAHPMVAQWQNDEQQHHTNQTAGTAFPDQQDPQNQKQWVKKCVPTREGHDTIENGISQRVVDETEQANVQSFEPMHEGGV
jgi:hypothetical protein